MGIPILVLLLAVTGDFARARQSSDAAQPPPHRPVPSHVAASPSVAVLPFTAVRDTADAAAAESLSQSVAASLARGRGVEVTPWSLVRQAQRASGGDLRRIADALGVRYVVDGAFMQIGTRVRLILEVIDAKDGSTLLSNSYESAADSLAVLADRVALEVASHVVPPVREAPETRWKPPTLLWIYLVLLGATALLAAQRRTSWFSLIGVATLPPYFIWILLDAYRSAPAGSPNETPKPPLPDWASMTIRPHPIQKTEILARDISGVAAAIAERKTTTRAGRSWALLHLSFSGYGDDPRALWEIPEVREWCAAVFREFPFLPFLLDGESCRHVLPCVLPVEVLARQAGTQQVKIGGIEAANTMQAITVSGNALCRTDLSLSDPPTAERLIEQATERLVSALQMNLGGAGAQAAEAKSRPPESSVRKRAKELADEYWEITSKPEAICAWCETRIPRSHGYVVKHRKPFMAAGIALDMGPAFICENCFASDPRIELYPESAAWLQKLKGWAEERRS